MRALMFLTPQLPGKLGVWQTVQIMRAMVDRASIHPWIRDRAASLTADARNDKQLQCARLLGWIRSVMRYVPDPKQVEALQDPVTVIERKLRTGEKIYGDCDDMAVYLGALLKSVGLPVTLNVVGRGKKYHHVYVSSLKLHLDPTLQVREANPRDYQTFWSIPL